jgi:HAD superfamily hydrolase (TIGR01509 family)
MRVETVVFDWYATLAVPHPEDFWTNFPQLIAARGGRPDPEAILAWERDHPLEHGKWSGSEHDYRAWQREMMAALAETCGLHGSVRDDFVDYVDDRRYTRLFDAYPDVAPTLSALRDRGVTVAICSNWDWCLDRHLTHNGLDGLLDVVVCSAIAGVRKPHPAIFELVLDRTGAEPTTTLFVGDNWHDDIAGAQAAGLTPVHIVRTDECATADHGTVACITGVDAVLDLCD